MARIVLPLLALMALSPLPALAEIAPFGPPPGAELRPDKLAAIDAFVAGEVAAGHIPVPSCWCSNTAGRSISNASASATPRREYR
jgi:hypothetical protein